MGFLGYHKARRRAGNTVAFLLMLYSALLSCVFERGEKELVGNEKPYWLCWQK